MTDEPMYIVFGYDNEVVAWDAVFYNLIDLKTFLAAHDFTSDIEVKRY